MVKNLHAFEFILTYGHAQDFIWDSKGGVWDKRGHETRGGDVRDGVIQAASSNKAKNIFYCNQTLEDINNKTLSFSS